MDSRALSFSTATNFTLQIKTRDDSCFLLHEDLPQRKDDACQFGAENEEGKTPKPHILLFLIAHIITC